MSVTTLKKLFARDLGRLYKEMEAYGNEAVIWHIHGKIANSGGNLCLHLIGNLNTFIGKELGQTTYVRDRDSEFALKDIPRSELLEKIKATDAVVSAALDKLNDADLAKEYPIPVFEEKTSTEYMLIHLATHLTYHLGQINYHRRLLDV